MKSVTFEGSEVQPHISVSYPAHAGYPLRRDFPAQAEMSLEYWIAPGAPVIGRRVRAGPVAGDDNGGSHHRLHTGQRGDEVAEGGAADFEVAVLVEGGAGGRQQHDGIGEP